MTVKLGKDLLVGDVIKVWWKPHRAKIKALRPYRGPLLYLWPGEDKPQFAQFCYETLGAGGVGEMTIEPSSEYETFLDGFGQGKQQA